MEVIKLESGSGITLCINGNTIFASDNTSYWLQNNKLIRDDGVSKQGVDNIKDALAIILMKYGGIKGRKHPESLSTCLQQMVCASKHKVSLLKLANCIQ